MPHSIDFHAVGWPPTKPSATSPPVTALAGAVPSRPRAPSHRRVEWPRAHHPDRALPLRTTLGLERVWDVCGPSLPLRTRCEPRGRIRGAPASDDVREPRSIARRLLLRPRNARVVGASLRTTDCPRHPRLPARERRVEDRPPPRRLGTCRSERTRRGIDDVGVTVVSADVPTTHPRTPLRTIRLGVGCARHGRVAPSGTWRRSPSMRRSASQRQRQRPMHGDGRGLFDPARGGTSSPVPSRPS